MMTLHLYPSIRSVYRWETRKATLGHVRPFRRTGNVRASVLRDHDLLLLALFRITYLKATANEINVPSGFIEFSQVEHLQGGALVGAHVL